jgi:cyanate lyase
MAHLPRLALSARLASRAILSAKARLTQPSIISIASRSFHSSTPNMSQHPIATLQVRNNDHMLSHAE